MKKLNHFIITLVLLTADLNAIELNGARVIQVEPSKFSKLIAQADVKERKTKKEEDKKKLIKAAEKSKATNAGKPVPSANLSGIGNGKEAALVVFAIVGLVVVFAWIPYFPTLAYKAFSEEDSVEIDHYLTIGSLLINGENREPSAGELREVRKGSLNSLNYSFFLREKSPKKRSYGISARFGYYHLSDRVGFAERKSRKDGAFFLIGPSLQFLIVPPFKNINERKSTGITFQLDLLGGTSNKKEIGIISTAIISMNIQLPNSLGIFFKPSFGGLYIDVDNERGIVSSTNNLALVYGLDLGFIF
jgi:hypothetical protein